MDGHDEYTCSSCGNTYRKTCSDEKAMGECKANFGANFKQKDCSVVCELLQ